MPPQHIISFATTSTSDAALMRPKADLSPSRATAECLPVAALRASRVKIVDCSRRSEFQASENRRSNLALSVWLANPIPSFLVAAGPCDTSSRRFAPHTLLTSKASSITNKPACPSDIWLLVGVRTSPAMHARSAKPAHSRPGCRAAELRPCLGHVQQLSSSTASH